MKPSFDRSCPGLWLQAGSSAVPLLKQETWTFTSVYPEIIGFFFSSPLHTLAPQASIQLPAPQHKHLFQLLKAKLGARRCKWFPHSAEHSRAEGNPHSALLLRTLKDLCPAFIYRRELIKQGFVFSNCFILEGERGKEENSRLTVVWAGCVSTAFVSFALVVWPQALEMHSPLQSCWASPWCMFLRKKFGSITGVFMSFPSCPLWRKALRSGKIFIGV